MKLFFLMVLVSCSTVNLQTKATKLCENNGGVNMIDFYQGEVVDIHCQDGATKFIEEGITNREIKQQLELSLENLDSYTPEKNLDILTEMLGMDCR